MAVYIVSLKIADLRTTRESECIELYKELNEMRDDIGKYKFFTTKTWGNRGYK